MISRICLEYSGAGGMIPEFAITVLEDDGGEAVAVALDHPLERRDGVVRRDHDVVHDAGGMPAEFGSGRYSSSPATIGGASALISA